MPKVLNVGGNNKSIALPSLYDGWEHILLDIDPVGKPDLLLDARLLETTPPAQYDSIYCSNNLEHYFRHDVVKVLRGFHHVLKPQGFAFIRVPDLGLLMRVVAEKDLDMNDTIYDSDSGPITVCDVIFGYGKKIESTGEDFYAHKNGFSRKSLAALLTGMGFLFVMHQCSKLEIRAFAFKHRPAPAVLESLCLPTS